MTTIQDLFSAAESGNGAAATELFAALYQELHAQAEHHLRRSGTSMTLGATTLLHEAYVKLAEREGLTFPDRGRFMSYASKALRGLVIDYVRARRARKRGGEFEIVPLQAEEGISFDGAADGRMEKLADALEALAAIDPQLTELVDLHFFGGFSLVEIAVLHDCSERTAQRNWRKARLALRRLMEVE